MTGLVEPIDDTPEDEADDTEDPMATPVPLPENDPAIEGDTLAEDAP